MLWSEVQVMDVTTVEAGATGPFLDPDCLELVLCGRGSVRFNLDGTYEVALLAGQMMLVAPKDTPVCSTAGRHGAELIRIRVLPDAVRGRIPSRRPGLERPGDRWARHRAPGRGLLDIGEINASKGMGIPTARNVDHIALTVPDLESACRFFVTHLGATLLYVEGPISRGKWMREHLNVHRDATCHLALLRMGPTCNLELFEYQSPDQDTAHPRNSDIGGHHLALYVDDIDAAFAYLQTVEGVVCQGTPQFISEGPIAGSRWVYFTTPWGLQMELCSPGHHMPYEQRAVARRYGPHPGPWSAGDAAAGRREVSG
jgi:catechol 2,3-dioxygenase-like lactoylglutathione lyase family enzyme